MSRVPQPPRSVREQFDLSGKHVVISGGAGYLGSHFAEAVAEMGARPILLDIRADDVTRTVEQLARAGFETDGLTLDLTQPAQVRAAVASLAERYERIDVLINAAALTVADMRGNAPAYFAPFEDYDKALWDRALDVNLTGTFLITQLVGSLMKRQGKGVIINIASDVAVVSPDHRIYEPDPASGYEGVPFNTTAAYSTSKAGLLALTRYLATYWARHGIRVNALSPAGVYREGQDPKFVAQLASRIPLGRMAFPQEYKGAIVFLASEASSFMTGANMIVDGGRTIW